jgi:hypothetical protein
VKGLQAMFFISLVSPVPGCQASLTSSFEIITEQFHPENIAHKK